MKKFKRGDIIEAPWTAGLRHMLGEPSEAYRYEVTHKDEDGVWYGKCINPPSIGNKPFIEKAVLGNNPKGYKLIERPSNKARQIENLTKALAESQKEATELNKAASGAKAEKDLLERQIEVDAWARDEAMLDAGYISIRALRSITIRGGVIERNQGGMRREADVSLTRLNGAQGRFFDRLLKELRK